MKKDSPIVPLEEGEIPLVTSLQLSSDPSPSPSITTGNNYLSPKPLAISIPTTPQSSNPDGAMTPSGVKKFLITIPPCSPSKVEMSVEAEKSLNLLWWTMRNG